MRVREEIQHLWHWLAGESSYEQGDETIVLRVLAERRQEIARRETIHPHPTLDSASGCLDCRVIQAPQDSHHCSVCGSEELVNLSMMLERGTSRIGRKPAAKHVVSVTDRL